LTPYTLYIIDDEEPLTRAFARIFENDYTVSIFSSAESALTAMPGHPPDLILLDIGLPGMNGICALRKIKQKFPDMVVIMITSFEEIDMVVTSMKSGAYDYVTKPIQMDALELTVRNALESIRLRKEVKLLQETYLKENLPCFIGNSKAIQDVMQFVEHVAQSPDTPILILGESGTGKELIASAIHYRSPNFRGPMVTVNCAAIPQHLIESELFGYEKGAFSGASAYGKKGLVEQAHEGTLFLDEVGDLNIEAQAKLLRFIEKGEFYKVGGVKKIHVKTRIVSATNKDLIELIEKGSFRTDLYYRLGVIKIKIPSLNKRREDIIPIAKYFLLKFSDKFNKSITGISPEAQTFLKEYHWGGNIRELKNTTGVKIEVT